MSKPRTRVMLEPRVGRRRAFGWLVSVNEQTGMARVQWDDGLVSGARRQHLLVLPRYQVRFRWIKYKTGAPGYAAELFDHSAYISQDDDGEWKPWRKVIGGRGIAGMQSMIEHAHENWKMRESVAARPRDAWGPFQGHAPRRNP